MKMTLRWYGPGYDSVTLENIKQIPGIKGIVTSLMGKQAGEVWTDEDINEIKGIVNQGGMEILAVDSSQSISLMILKLEMKSETSILLTISRV